MGKAKLPRDGTTNTNANSSGSANRTSVFTDLVNFFVTLGALFNHPTWVDDRNITESQDRTVVSLLGSLNNDPPGSV